MALSGRGGQGGGLAGRAVGIEEVIHRLRAASQHWAQFLAIHLFRRTGVRMANQMRDVLNWYPCARQQRDEAVPQLSRCPFLRVEPSMRRYLAKRTPNVGRVEWGAALCREDKIIFGPSCRASHATLSLPASVRSKRDYAIVRELKSAPTDVGVVSR